MIQRTRKHLFWLALAALSAAGTQLAPSASAGAAPEPATVAEDLMVVDCLLPPKIRRLGTRGNYQAPRQPVRETAARCRIRGGEYTAPDQANLRTALDVWLPRAKSGDANAQYYVGQIFEKGLGATADYEAAITWYRRAAEQGSTAAAVSLGSLYELGMGVERDEVAALGWYRKAAGLAKDLVVLEESAYRDLLQARNEAEASAREIRDLEEQSRALATQLEELRAATDQERRERSQSFEVLLARLESDLAAKRAELEQAHTRIASLERAGAAEPEDSPGADESPAWSVDRLDFGRYYALVIGNTDYRDLPPLRGATRDAEKMAALLEEQYRFEVRLLLDATRVDILRALNEMREVLTEKDNLLVFYAGRGVRDEARDVAYWQPVDADPENPVDWIPSGVLVDHLDIMPAKHVLVVADSVFSGLRTRSAVAQLRTGSTPEKRFFHLRSLLGRRSRLALTAGAEPSADRSETPFTSALLEALSENGELLEASELHRRVRKRLQQRAPDQSPEFATLRWARNDVADFFFVPNG